MKLLGYQSGLSDHALRRIAAAFGHRIAVPIDEYETQQEYGDYEDYESYSEPEEVDYGGLTEEQFLKGQTNLALMGRDVDTMSTKEIVKAIYRNEDILSLTPKYNVYGRWVHTIRQTDVDKLKSTIESMLGSDKEVCVTDANEKEFWNFSEYRRFGLVFEGPCKVLWNADMYSTEEAGKLVSYGGTIEYLDKMTEGWVNLSEVQLVGLRVKEDDELWEDLNDVKSVIDELGIVWDSGGALEKILIDVEFVTEEEAQQYCEIPVDFQSDNPEILYEEVKPGKTYQDSLNEKLYQAVTVGNVETVVFLLEKGAEVNADNGQALYWAASNGDANMVKVLLDAGAIDYQFKAIHAAITSNSVETFNLFYYASSRMPDEGTPIVSAVRSGAIDVVKRMVEIGYVRDESNYLSAASEAARSGQEAILSVLLPLAVDANDPLPSSLNTALRIAASKGYTYIVEALLEYEASPVDMKVALEYAAGKGFYEICEMLLNADVDREWDNYEFLRAAIANNRVRVVELILSRYGGFDSVRDKIECVTMAEEQEHAEMVELLNRYDVRKGGSQ